MEKDIYFAALGGGQRIGASCYYLKLGKSNIILDCGIGYSQGLVFEPDTHFIQSSRFVESMSQISRIFISHAHNDHVGYIPNMMNMIPGASFYMTETTASLTEYQIYYKKYLKEANKKSSSEYERLALQSQFSNIVPVSYFKNYDFRDYNVTFYPAGHIPGASMICFEYGTKKILYTGDFSISDTPLTDGCKLPEKMEVDTLILCGLHAKHPDYRREENSLFLLLKSMLKALRQNKKIYCRVKQLSKGIELLKYINLFLRERELNQFKVYIDRNIMELVYKMESLSVPIIEKSNYTYKGDKVQGAHIVIGTRSHAPCNEYLYLEADFTLHVDFKELLSFVKQVNAKTAIVVHSASDTKDSDYTIEQALMTDADCRTQFIFAEEKNIYKL